MVFKINETGLKYFVHKTEWIICYFFLKFWGSSFGDHSFYLNSCNKTVTKICLVLDILVLNVKNQLNLSTYLAILTRVTFW